jgi:hypothetical protein
VFPYRRWARQAQALRMMNTLSASRPHFSARHVRSLQHKPAIAAAGDAAGVCGIVILLSSSTS